VTHARVGGHAQVVEDQASVFVELAHFLGDALHALGLNYADGEAAQAGDVLGAVAGADAAAVLVVVPIEDVVAAVFDGPVATVDFEQALSIGLLGRSTGDAVGEIVGRFAGLFVDRDSFDGEGLADVGKVEIVVEVGGRPDIARFNASMVGRVMHDEVGLFSILKHQRHIVKQRGLIGFDGEVVVGLALIDQVVGKSALGVQGIGGDVFVFEIEAVEQGDSHTDLVGLLEFFKIARYGQNTDFFWV
jgi:hypothetical protein